MSPGSALSPSPGYRLARLARRYFSLLTPFFAFFPHCGAWPQARMMKINPKKTKIMFFQKYETKNADFYFIIDSEVIHVVQE